jgi:hypothetical protein
MILYTYSDIDFLREEELLNSLRQTSKHYVPITCLQISNKGLELIKKVKKKDKYVVLCSQPHRRYVILYIILVLY